MKKILLIPFLLFSILVFSQGSTIVFISQGGTPVTTDALTNLKLPLKISFSKDFNGKEIVLKNNINNQIFNGSQTLGTGELTFHGNDPFEYIFETDMKTNPGDNNIPSKEILLTFSGKDFILKITDNTPDNGGDGKNNNDGYDAGYIYYDAMKLLDKNSDDKLKMKILGSYGIDKTTVENNPYLKEIFGELYSKGLPEGVFGGLIGNLGNTDVTNFAAGAARFLAERTKEELNEAFFSKMKEQLNAYPELTTVFPQTSSSLNIIETYSYASVIQVLKESFETDIQNLPENLYNVKSLTSENCNADILKGSKLAECKDRLNKLKTFFESQDGRWIGLGIFTVKEAIQSSNPADLLKSITESDEFTGIKEFSEDNSKYASYNVASSIELTNFISQSLISKDDKQIWITSKELTALLKTQTNIKVYLGLLLAKEQKKDVVIDFYKSDNSLMTFGDVLREAYKTYSLLEPQIKSLIKNSFAAFSSANNAVKKIIAATDKVVEAEPQALYDYYRTFTAALKPIAHNTLLSDITGRKDIGAEYDKIEKYLNPSVDIAYHIATKKYSAAIYDATILLSNLKQFDDKFKPITKSFVKYGTLISTVANAQSSDEVKQALDASVLPVGSYSIKRKTSWSLSINAYVGAYWSYANKEDYLPSLGLSAPIGFNISKGFSKTGNAGGVSLNIQILDLGALVNYYLLEGDTASIPNDFKVRLSNIFAPGFNLCYNIPKTPLSLAWGGQYIPTLYKYEQISGTNELAPTNAFRMQLSVLIDIPLFNLKVWDFNE